MCEIQGRKSSMPTWCREHTFTHFTLCSSNWAQPKHLQGRSDLCPNQCWYSIFECQWNRKQCFSFKVEFPAVVLWGATLWWAREERGNLLSCCGLSCSAGRQRMNALFIKVPGHGGNGFPSVGAGAVSTAALAGLLLNCCPSPPSCLPTQTSRLGHPPAWQGIWAREKMLLCLYPACCTEQRSPSQRSDR